MTESGHSAPLEGYEGFLRDLKDRIQAAQVKAQQSVGREKTALLSEIARAIPSQSYLAEKALQDLYSFDFLDLEQQAQERELKRTSLEKIKDFLLELGAGFAFMGSQYHLEVGGEDFYIDLLFYHHRLRCLVAIDLKIGDFRPEYAGKMNFYLSALDDLVRHPQDAPSLGLVLCKGKNRTVAEYALRDMNKPIGVAGYRLTHTLPDDLQRALPDPAVLERLVQASEMT